MPRIREIKPEFFLDEELAQVSHAARLLFVGLWNLCDRAGRLEDRPARIKAQVFPYGSEDCDALLSELATHRGQFIIRYEVEGRRYVQVRSFTRHQRPHPKEALSKLPEPPAVERRDETRKETAGRETPAKQVDPSGGSMGTWAHGRMGDGTSGVDSPSPAEVVQIGVKARPIPKDDRITYGRAVWQEFCERFDIHRDMSSAEHHLVAKWMDANIPLAVVLRGIGETGGKPRNLYASEAAVARSIEYWNQAAGVTA